MGLLNKVRLDSATTDSAKNLAALIVFSVLILYVSVSSAENKRPFWTEKSAFIEGKDLLVVGIASHAKTEEEGRQKAFESGKVELMNYAQITDLEAQGLVIETQMTYEEPNQDGTMTVFRLLHVPVDKLLVIQGRVKAQGEAHEQEIKKLQSDLLARQKNLEAQSHLVDQKLKDISGIQSSLSQRAKQLDEQQKKVQALLSQLTAKSSDKGSSSPSKSLNLITKPPSIEILEGQVKEAEEKMNQREQAILKIQQRAIERIEQKSKTPCKFVREGMAMEEVKSMIGKADGKLYLYWVYGKSEIYFDDVFLVDFVVDENGKTCQGNRPLYR